MNIQESLVFDDVLIVPKYSEIESRSKIDLSVIIKTRMPHLTFAHPIIPANMATIFEYQMAQTVIQLGGLGFLHRFMNVEKQLEILRKLLIENTSKNVFNHIGVSIGVKSEDYMLVDRFVNNGIEIMCIDIAHGDSKLGVEMTEYISKKYPHIFLISGNVATGSGAKRLWEAGADAVKVGLGSGTICSTRVETGIGVGQLSALIDVSEARKEIQSEHQLTIIADGGCNKTGDVSKALLFAEFVMLGGMIAGSDQCPGDVIEKDGKKYKRYDGSSTHRGVRIEGVQSLVPYKGSVEKVFNRILDGIQSSCSYQGVSNLNDLKKDFTLVRVSNSGLRESNIHDVMEIKE